MADALGGAATRINGLMDWWIDGWRGMVLGDDHCFTVHLNRRLGAGNVPKFLRFFWERWLEKTEEGRGKAEG